MLNFIDNMTEEQRASFGGGLLAGGLISLAGFITGYAIGIGVCELELWIEEKKRKKEVNRLLKEIEIEGLGEP